MANSGLQGAESASVGLYSGILENTSNNLAMAAAIVEGIGALATALKDDKNSGGATKEILDSFDLEIGVVNLNKKFKEIFGSK